MKLTYYGHSCFNVEINEKHLLFDPFITRNPLARAVDVKKIKADYIFCLTLITTTLQMQLRLQSKLAQL